jgi:cytochrome bd-type quinol oxidase subunit 2
MSDDSELRRDLLSRIESRRASVQAFLRAHRPRTRRRANAAIVLSSLAAVFTAGPALGGETFADTVQRTLDLTSDSVVWRVLCLLAMLVAIGSAVLTNLSKSQDDVGRLSTAEAANAELEGLTTLLEFGHLSVQDAVKLFQEYSVKIPFIDDLPREVGAGRPGR